MDNLRKFLEGGFVGVDKKVQYNIFKKDVPEVKNGKCNYDPNKLKETANKIREFFSS